MKYKIEVLFAALWIFATSVYATETPVITVGGGAAGVSPGEVITVTHSGSTPSAATIKVPTSVTGTITSTTGDLNVATAGKGVVIEEGTAGSGRSGTFVYTTGALTTISNATVTANTRVIFNRVTGTAHSTTSWYSTNQVGVGRKLITNNPETNTFEYFMWEGQ